MSDRDRFDLFLVVYDVVTRKIRTSTSAFEGSAYGDPETVSVGGISQLEIDRKGDAAWIAQIRPSTTQVYAAPLGSRGQARKLDDDPTIEIGSLAVNDSFVYWQRTGAGPFSAGWRASP